MSLSFGQIIPWLLHFKYLALFPLAVVEGPIITVITGFLSSLGFIGFFSAYLVIVAGDLTGDGLYYLFGRYGGRKFIDHWGRYFGISESKVESLEKSFDKRSGRILLTGKIFHGAGGAVLVAAGAAKMPFGKFMLFNFFATIIKSMLLLLLGYYYGQAITTINSYLEKIAFFTTGIAILFFVIYYFYLRKKNNNSTI